MMKKIVLGAALLAVVAALAPAANAVCNPPKTAGTYNATPYFLAYWISPTGNTGTLVGQWWQTGNSVGANTGNCTGFLYFGTAGIGLNLDMGTCGTGCPANLSTLAVLAQKQTADGKGSEFLMATAAETPADSRNFDYGRQGNHNLIAIPPPRVTGSSRSGTNVNLNVTMDPIAAGLYGTAAPGSASGYRILSKSSPGDPGRNASAYDATPLGTFTTTAGAGASGAVVVDCSTTSQDRWVVTQLTFEGGTVFSNAVSGAVRVGCNPLLADPHFKIIPKTPANKTNKPILNPNN